MRNAAEKHSVSRSAAALRLMLVSTALCTAVPAPVAWAIAEIRQPAAQPALTTRPGTKKTVTDTSPMLAFEGAATPLPAAEPPKTPGPAIVDDPAPADAVAAAIDAPAGEIVRDMSLLPAPVKRMREKLIEAAASGDIERLRPLLNVGPHQTQIMNNETDDPVDMLKSFSGDPDGQEILAIFIDLLSTGAVRLQAGKPDEIYVWPYFAGKTLSTLTPPERVELLRIVTAGDLLGMEETGAYNFYRIGISPDGQWKFVAGGE